MTRYPDAKIFLVDDDVGVREALSWLLRTRRLLSESYDSGDAFLAEVLGWQNEPTVPCCLLLDVCMPGMSGLALFDFLLTQPWQAAMPVIFLSGHADVPTAVDAVKRGAFDFCEKPFSDNALVDRVEQALAQSAQVQAQRRSVREVQQRIDGLTERERSVMQLVIEGLPNKLVADQLHISVRTVEVHRSNVFDKMGVKSAVELANVLRAV
ncbi:response regulator transcription factor [Hydrogenophaga sp.]|uniref:response regulator transcription factor n=1 Tax=Hydrogenophaga sp. TaxID=1904254 RepID=UPI003564390F